MADTVNNRGIPARIGVNRCNQHMRLLVFVVVCATMCVVGFVMAFRPTLYRKWAEWSWTGRHLSRMTEQWPQQQQTIRTLGILFITFGVCSFAGFVLLAYTR